jgi:hypothetical protein
MAGPASLILGRHVQAGTCRKANRQRLGCSEPAANLAAHVPSAPTPARRKSMACCSQVALTDHRRSASRYVQDFRPLASHKMGMADLMLVSVWSARGTMRLGDRRRGHVVRSRLVPSLASINSNSDSYHADPPVLLIMVGGSSAPGATQVDQARPLAAPHSLSGTAAVHCACASAPPDLGRLDLGNTPARDRLPIQASLAPETAKGKRENGNGDVNGNASSPAK